MYEKFPIEKGKESFLMRVKMPSLPSALSKGLEINRTTVKIQAGLEYEMNHATCPAQTETVIHTRSTVAHIRGRLKIPRTQWRSALHTF